MLTEIFVCSSARKETNFVFIRKNKNMFIDMQGYVSFHLYEFSLTIRKG